MPIAPQNQEFDIFISHASAHDSIVSQIAELLEQYNLNIWVDHLKGIDPGNDFADQIGQGIKASKAGLFVLTPRSNHSEWCRRELHRLDELDKHIYVLLLEEVDPADVVMVLAGKHYLDIRADFTHPVERVANHFLSEIKNREANIDGKPSASVPIAKITTSIPLQRRTTDSSTSISYLTEVEMVNRKAEFDNILLALPTQTVSLLGIAGIGKTRLAAHVSENSPEIQGIIWHTCSHSSKADDIVALLAKHFDLAENTPEANVLEKLREASDREIRNLVVIDNGSEIDPDDNRYINYKKMILKIHQNGGEVLLTSNFVWDNLRVLNYPEELAFLTEKDAYNLIDNIARVRKQLANKLTHDDKKEISRLTLGHPGLIKQTLDRLIYTPTYVVIENLKALSHRVGTTVATLDAQIQLTRQEIKKIYQEDLHSHTIQDVDGEAFLKRVIVCPDGFDYTAGQIISDLSISDYIKALKILIEWHFLEMRDPSRYYVNELVKLSLDPDDDAINIMIHYFNGFVQENFARYKNLQPEWLNILHILRLGYEHKNIAEFVPMIIGAYGYMIRQGNYDLAMMYLREAEDRVNHDLEIMPKGNEFYDQKLESYAQVAVGIARIHINLSEPDEAIRYISEKIDFVGNTPRALSHLQWIRGIAYTKIRPADFKNAENDLEQALGHAEKSKQYYRFAHIGSTLGTVYARKGEFGKSGEIWQETKILKEKYKIYDLDNLLENNLGTLELELGKIEKNEGRDNKARTHFKKAEDILVQALLRAEKEQDNQMIVMICANLAEVRRQLKEFNEASKIGRNGQIIAENMNWSEGILHNVLQLKEALREDNNLEGLRGLLDTAGDKSNKSLNAAFGDLVPVLRAELAFDAGLVDVAESDYQKELGSTNYKHALAHFGIARIRFSAGNHEQARDHANQSLDILNTIRPPEDYTQLRVQQFIADMPA